MESMRIKSEIARSKLPPGSSLRHCDNGGVLNMDGKIQTETDLWGTLMGSAWHMSRLSF